ncbi:MAG TPA: class I SAM-dependent RNA methyltransferase [Candidatus Omnitrophota bacterium]|nr:class I SAM-dependent RNA methyltransferase [Candidatus Omnitrophota bacterium]
MNKITLIATSTFGLEALLKDEVLDLGLTGVKVFDGKVEFSATLSDIPRLNINLRVADRVLLKLGEFPAKDFDQLFGQTKAIPWEDWITKDGKVTVIGKSVKSVLMSVRSCQSMVKKAIVERFKEKYGIDWLPETGPEFTIQVALFKDVAQLTLDTTGPGLNKRGYRTAVGEAPIRENLAAALVFLSSWRKEKMLLDPMCGSGTILIEAAMIGRNMAPGLKRAFASEAWPSIEAKAWEAARREATEAILPGGSLKIFGYDNDRARIQDCHSNAKKCGVDKDIVFKAKDIAGLNITEEKGAVITNPPYGLNVGEPAQLPALYEAINKAFEKKHGWAVYLLTADKNFPTYFKRSSPDKVRKLFNGTIEVQYFQYHSLL